MLDIGLRPRLETLVKVFESFKAYIVEVAHEIDSTILVVLKLVSRLLIHLDEEVVGDDSSCVLAERQDVLILHELKLDVVINDCSSSVLTCLLLLIDQALLHLLRVCHVPLGPVVRLFRLHGQLDAENHIASTSTAQVVLILQEFCCGVQIKECLVAEV